MPEGIARLPRGVATALVARDARSAQLWSSALLMDAVAAGPVFLLVSSAEIADNLLRHAALNEALAQSRLVIWTMATGLQVQLRQQGLTPLFSELTSAGLRPHHTLHVMDAERLFQGLNLRQLQRVGDQLRAWSLKRKTPVVLDFFELEPMVASSTPTGRMDLLPMLLGLSNRALHVATLGTAAESTTLRLERWNSEQGAIFETGFGLYFDQAAQRLQHDGSRTQGQGQTLIEAPDQHAVIATRTAVTKQAGIPPHWQIVDTAEDLEIAAASSIGATVLIDAGSSSEFEARARLVHHLRMTRPSSLKIVVRETADKLRSNSEQALLQLGANAIFYRELGFSRLLQLLEDVRHQSYVRPVEANYPQALGAFLPVLVCGYQTASEFSRLVREMLARTREIGLEHSMVRLDIAPQIAHIIALRTCKMSRDGDLITAGSSAIYLFLFACREPDIESTLKRLFVVPVAQLFTAQSTDCTAAGMIAMLDGLDKEARLGLPDYTHLLAPSTGFVSAASAGSPPIDIQPSGSRPVANDASLELAAPDSKTNELVVESAAQAQPPSMHANPISQRQRTAL